MLTKDIIELINEKEFISIATCDFDGRPNAAPKFILKIDGKSLYLVDYIIGRTYANLKINPRVSLSLFNPHTLIGYQLNGAAVIIDKGAEYKKLSSEMENKLVRLTAQHIIEEVRGGHKHENFEVSIRSKFIIIKVTLEETVAICPQGKVERGAVEK